MKFTKYLKRKTLKETFNTKLKQNYALGTDGVSTNKFSDIIDEEIDIIKRKVKNHTYNISPYKEKLIIKGKDSNPRTISIPTNRDKLTLSALQKFLDTKFKGKLSDNNVNTKIFNVKQTIKSNRFDSFIKLDIKSFYPNIDHEILLNKMRAQINDKEALYLLEKVLKQIAIPTGRRKDRQNAVEPKGVAQGLSISNILSSIYLNSLDKKYAKKTNLAYFRYVDDILILCNESDVADIKESISMDTKKLKLEIHDFKANSDKSAFGSIHKDKFQFLGFEFFADLVSVREKSIDKLRDRIIGVFYIHKERNNKSLYRELNLKISGCIYDEKQYGWMHFFRQMDDQTLLYSLDIFVKKCFTRFHRKYKESKVKKFTKTYFKLKNYDIDKLDKNTYIPKFDTAIGRGLKLEIIKLKDDVEFY